VPNWKNNKEEGWRIWERRWGKNTDRDEVISILV
jgi:hypothetical protein